MMESKRNSLLREPLFAESAVGAALHAKPLGFIDIGARGGVHPLVQPLAGVTAVLGFEPDREECERLNADRSVGGAWARFNVEPVALGAGEGPARLHLLSTPTNHSLLKPNTQFTQRYRMVKWQEIGAVPLHTTTLDKVLYGTRSGEDYWGEFIKLDTQGTEFEILQGAERTLAERTVAIISEVEFFAVMEGQKLFSELELFLRNQGFCFYGFIATGFRSCKRLDKRKETGRERLFYADAVFLKDPLPGPARSAPLSERGYHALFACALLLGYYDFALELALSRWATGDEARRVEQLVRSCAALPPSQTFAETLELAQRVRLKPELANIEVGRFVDRRRWLCDYGDTQA